MTLLLLIASFAVILAGCEGFTNGIEWFGKQRGLGEGAVGSILAAIGTAMPETIIPLIAIVLGGGGASRDIGVGAILGAPFMLSTLALFVTGISLAVFHFTRGRPRAARINRGIIGRDLTFFLSFYLAAVIAGLLHLKIVDWALAISLWAAYLVYAFITLRSEGDLEGDTRPLYLARARPPALPRLRWILLQVVISLGAIVFGARLFVNAAADAAAYLGVSALVISMLITPVATELPEKFNSVSWIRSGKDTLALGNITGAMVFQSVFPVSIGLLLTPWELNTVSLVSAAMALGSGALLLMWVRLSRAIAWWMLLLGGAFYAFFVVYALNGAL